MCTLVLALRKIPIYGPARGEWQVDRDEAVTLGGRVSSDTRGANDAEEGRGLLHRQSSRGRRKRETPEEPLQQPQGLMLSNVEQRNFTEAEYTTRGPAEL